MKGSSKTLYIPPLVVGTFSGKWVGQLLTTPLASLFFLCVAVNGLESLQGPYNTGGSWEVAAGFHCTPHAFQLKEP